MNIIKPNPLGRGGSRDAPSAQAMFTAYFDRSATDDGAVTTVAGFVSRASKWGKFEKDWRALLPAGYPYFHMTDFVSGRGCWKGWEGPQNSETRIALIQNLFACIKKHTNRGFALSIRRRHFDECNSRWMLQENCGNPYVLLGMECLEALSEWANKKNLVKKNILCILEHGDDGRGKLINMGLASGFSVIHQSKSEIRAFDACDLLAWRARALIHDTFERKMERDPKWGSQVMNSLDALEKLVRDPKGISHMTPKTLESYCQSKQLERRVK